MQRGQYQIIRTDGTETIIPERPSLDKISKVIGASWVDTILLQRQKNTVMIVADTGALDGKPVNPKATALMRKTFGEQYPSDIHGDVALVNDGDFA